MADDFTFTAVQGKGNPYHLAIPAGNLKAIGTSAQIGRQGDNLAFMSKLRSFACMSDQQQSILAHDTVDAFVIDGSLSHALQRPVQQRAYPALAVGHAVIHQLANQGQQPGWRLHV
jgi:hypothetical protein